MSLHSRFRSFEPRRQDYSGWTQKVFSDCAMEFKVSLTSGFGSGDQNHL